MSKITSGLMSGIISMQISEETAEKIIECLIEQIDEKKRTVTDLNYVVAEQADENVEKSERICELLKRIKTLEKGEEK